jgi:hypothetical protein
MLEELFDLLDRVFDPGKGRDCAIWKHGRELVCDTPRPL